MPAPGSPDAGRVDDVAALRSVPSLTSLGQLVLFPGRAEYLALVTELHAAGFETCSDLCGVDYLTAKARPALPPEVGSERFEVVVSLLSVARVARLRLRVQVPEADPVVDSLFGCYPGTENMEREAFDMFGIRFRGHPDMSRILMPPDWEGHPLRKDYAVGRVPVQFREAPGPR